MALVRIVGVAAITATLGGVAAAASNQASRIVDRTVLCKTWGAGYPDPLRVLTVAAAPRLGTEFQPYAQTLNGQSGDPKGVVASIHMGRVAGEDQVILSRVSCTPTRLRIPLASKGLKRGEGQFGSRYRCAVPAAILIRIRAEFRNPVTFSPAVDAPYLLTAKGRISRGSLAVTTKGKQPISFATVESRSGKASLFVVKPRCNLVD